MCERRQPPAPPVQQADKLRQRPRPGRGEPPPPDRACLREPAIDHFSPPLSARARTPKDWPQVDAAPPSQAPLHLLTSDAPKARG